MLNPDQQRLVLKAINAGDKPALTMRVWLAAISHIRYDTGEIMAGRERLAEDAETTPDEVSRALNRLFEIGALLKLRPGCYEINPHVGWTGDLMKRQAAAKDESPARRIEPAAPIPSETSPIPGWPWAAARRRLVVRGKAARMRSSHPTVPEMVQTPTPAPTAWKSPWRRWCHRWLKW